MKYLMVEWCHSFSNEPVELYSEIDEDGWEVRKVEVYADGSSGYADAHTQTKGSGLSKERLPSFEEIAADPQFNPREISADEFDQIWRSFVSDGS